MSRTVAVAQLQRHARTGSSASSAVDRSSANTGPPDPSAVSPGVRERPIEWLLPDQSFLTLLTPFVSSRHFSLTVFLVATVLYKISVVKLNILVATTTGSHIFRFFSRVFGPFPQLLSGFGDQF